MPEGLSFEDFLRRVRAGDERAAADLVRLYEPTIRRVIRFRLTGSRLGTALDSVDVCQSVLASFFVRAASGEYDLSNPDDLVKLLVTMARNKLASQARRQQAARRDHRRNQAGALEEDRLPADQPSPSQCVANKELLQEVQRRLTPQERQLVELRGQGLEWAEIAEQLGETPAALRKRLSRALDRVSGELGL